MGVRKEGSLRERLSLALRIEPFPHDGKGILRSALWLGPVLFLLDLLSKWIVVWTLGETTSSGTIVGGKAEVIPGFLYFHLTFNEGMAFGIGDGAPWARGIFAGVSFLGTILILYFWLRHLHKDDVFANVLFAMAFAGALGNGIDRAFYWTNVVGFNGVVDFVECYLFGPDKAPFAVFNLADAFLVVSIFLAIVLILVRMVKEGREGESK